ncbi:MAG: hypothetical protein WDM77_08245 [Steroidobacteraceae bacterium]
MYTAPAAALTAELFGKNKWAIVATTLLPAVAWFAGKAYLGALPITGSAAPISFLILLGCSVQLACIFAYIDTTAGGMSGGFPKHILLLPAPTWLLALVPIVAGSLFISGFVLLWLRYVSAVHFDWYEQLVMVAAVSSLMCWLQAMSWELLPSRPLQIVVLTVAAIAAVLSVVSLVAPDSANLFGRPKGAVGLSVTAVSGLSLAYLAVIRSRRGDTLDFGAYIGRLVRSSGLSAHSAALPALPDALAAQNWYEWRVYGRLLPTCMIILTGGPLVAQSFARIRHSPSIVLSGLLLFLFFLIAPLVGGAYISKNMTRRVQVGLGLFDATRPLADVEIALAKLRLACRSHLVGFAIVSATVAVIVLSSRNNAALLEYWSRLRALQGTLGSSLSLLLLLIFALAASWTGAVYFMSLQLFSECVDRKKHGWQISLGILALFVLALDLGGRLNASRDSALAWLSFPHYQLLIPATVLLAIGLCLLPRYRSLHPLSAVSRLAAGFAAAAGLCLIAVWQLRLSSGYEWALSSLVVTTALLAFIPFLLLPILVDWNRHR